MTTRSEGTEPEPLRRDRSRLTDPRIERWLEALVATPGLTARARPRRGAAACSRRSPRRAGARSSASRGRSWTWARAAARPGSRSPRRCREREVDPARVAPAQVRLPRALDARAPEPPRRLRARRGAAGRLRTASRLRRRSRRRPSRPSGACRSSRPGGAAVLFVGPSAEAERVAAVAERLAAELVESPRRVARSAEARSRRPGASRAAREWPENVRSPS